MVNDKRYSNLTKSFNANTPVHEIGREHKLIISVPYPISWLRSQIRLGNGNLRVPQDVKTVGDHPPHKIHKLKIVHSEVKILRRWISAYWLIEFLKNNSSTLFFMNDWLSKTNDIKYIWLIAARARSTQVLVFLILASPVTFWNHRLLMLIIS